MPSRLASMRISLDKKLMLGLFILVLPSVMTAFVGIFSLQRTQLLLEKEFTGILDRVPGIETRRDKDALIARGQAVEKKIHTVVNLSKTTIIIQAAGGLILFVLVGLFLVRSARTELKTQQRQTGIFES